MIFILLIGIFVLIVALIPIGISYLVYRWLAKKGYKKIGLLIIFSVVIWEGYSIYTAIYPTDSFYKEEFTNDTNIPFPETGKIIQKNASYPDLHGDYSATAVFSVDSSDYLKILEGIKNNNKFSFDTNKYSFDQGGIKFSNKSSQSYTALQTIETDLIFSIYFNRDKKHISFDRGSW